MSDFLDADARVLEGLDLFRRSRFDVILFHVVHPEELDLPDLAAARFLETEGGRGHFNAEPDPFGRSTAAGSTPFLQEIKAGCQARGCDWYLAKTSDEPYGFLRTVSCAREARTKMNWLSFTNPWLLAGLAAVGLPVLIHYLTRARPRRVAFPPFKFLVEACAGQQAVHRLRTFLLLTVRCLAVLALVLLFARPFLKPTGAADPSRRRPAGGAGAGRLAFDAGGAARGGALCARQGRGRRRVAGAGIRRRSGGHPGRGTAAFAAARACRAMCPRCMMPWSRRNPPSSSAISRPPWGRPTAAGRRGHDLYL